MLYRSIHTYHAMNASYLIKSIKGVDFCCLYIYIYIFITLKPALGRPKVLKNQH